MNEADTTAGKAAQTAARRLRIDVGAPLHEKEDLAWEALVAANDGREPEVMLRGTELVRATDEGALLAFSRDSLSRRLSQVAAFGSEGRDGEWKPKDPPKDVVMGLLARHGGEYPGAPRVERVVGTPTLDGERRLVGSPGHHEQNRTYLHPSAGLGGVGPSGDPDSAEDVEDALVTICGDYLGDFMFADEGSEAHALALLLLPFVRDAIQGPTPMHAILAPDVGSGKTTLAQACLLPGCGLVPAQAGARSDDEWRKRITAALLAGSPAVLLDNLSGELDSGALAAALTTGTWTDRVLGETRMATLPVRNAWVATGNNLDMTSEQVRRAVPIFLQPGEVRPSDKPVGAFRHPDLLGWGEGHRRRLVECALTLVEHWRRGAYMVEGGYVYVRSGEDPMEGKRTMGSFGGWAKTMGGILDSCGMKGFLTNLDRLRDEADGKGREAAEFLAAVHALGLPAMEVADMAQALQGAQIEDKPLDRYLPEGLDLLSPKFSEALGRWLGRNRNRWQYGYRVVEEAGHRRRHWQVVKSAA
jgi:putative DNA primase/helicase